MEFQHVETIKRCVEVGLGIAPLPRMAVAEELASGQLAALHWDGPELHVSTYLVWNPQRHLDSAGNIFLQHVRKMLGKAQ
jgi:DNA-binding transcriptional LysR family regulator